MHDPELFSSILIDGASRYGISLKPEDIERFRSYVDMVHDWNRRMNLVSRRDMDRFLEYHILDSLKVASCVDFSAASRMLDFGSGAGLPGIPLALAFPHLDVTLLDSRKKRCGFLDEIVNSLFTGGVHVLCSRIENLPDDLNASFDLVITRATTKLDAFHHLARRFVRSGGSLVAIKGPDIDAEIVSLKKVCDRDVFNIQTTAPEPFRSVRTGAVVIITRA